MINNRPLAEIAKLIPIDGPAALLAAKDALRSMDHIKNHLFDMLNSAIEEIDEARHSTSQAFSRLIDQLVTGELELYRSVESYKEAHNAAGPETVDSATPNE